MKLYPDKEQAGHAPFKLCPASPPQLGSMSSIGVPLALQEIDSVEYGLTDIQEYYANTGALKRAAEAAKGGCSWGKRGSAAGHPVQGIGTMLRMHSDYLGRIC
jgi:hypothetical protein